MQRKNISISEEQEAWIKETHLNLSRFVQAKLKEEMDKDAKQK